VVHKYFLAIGSKPEDGSSKNYKSGPPIRVLATHNFLLLPPDKFFDLLFLKFPN